MPKEILNNLDKHIEHPEKLKKKKKIVRIKFSLLEMLGIVFA